MAIEKNESVFTREEWFRMRGRGIEPLCIGVAGSKSKDGTFILSLYLPPYCGSHCAMVSHAEGR